MVPWDILRALVNGKTWAYCVVWKLGDDPSRFIEWSACLCNGGSLKMEDENVPEKHKIAECKDTMVKHLAKTPACKKLAQLPSAIPLYSGVHGDVVISKQPRWSSGNEIHGTQVLIPVPGGLIELYSTKRVPKDEKMITCILNGFSVSPEQENMLTEDQEQRISTSFYGNYASFEDSPACSSLSTDHLLLKLVSDHSIGGNSSFPVKSSSEEYADSSKTKSEETYTERNDENSRIMRRYERGPYKSKNLMTERKRRKRINDGMLALRALVPKISKMDRASTLGDAADYIKELEQTIKIHLEQLKEVEEETVHLKPNTNNFDNALTGNKSTEEQITIEEAQIEVSQLGTRVYLVKLICKHKRGSFSRLLEAMDSLGINAVNANVTTWNGSSMCLLTVEGSASEAETPSSLRRSLIHLVSSIS